MVVNEMKRNEIKKESAKPEYLSTDLHSQI